MCSYWTSTTGNVNIGVTQPTTSWWMNYANTWACSSSAVQMHGVVPSDELGQPRRRPDGRGACQEGDDLLGLDVEWMNLVAQKLGRKLQDSGLVVKRRASRKD